MKIKANYVLRQVADTWVVFPVGEAAVDFNGIFRLNETAVALWTALEKGACREELAKALTEKFAVTYEHALQSTDNFLQMLREAGCLEENETYEC